MKSVQLMLDSQSDEILAEDFDISLTRSDLRIEGEYLPLFKTLFKIFEII